VKVSQPTQSRHNSGSVAVFALAGLTAVILAGCPQVVLYTLSVEISGPGSVQLSPEGGRYLPGTEVTLTAVPEEGYRLARWEGDLVGTTNPATITMDADRHVKAVFRTARTYSLAIQIVGRGGVSVWPPAEEHLGVFVFEDGTQVQLTADPWEGYEFRRWEGAVTGTDNPAQITLAGDELSLVVTAVFAETHRSRVIAQSP